MPTAGKKKKLPYHLPSGPDAELNSWIGKYLAAKCSAPDVAKTTGLPIGEIRDIENGRLHICLGKLRQLLKSGYGCSLEEVLEACFNAHDGRFDPINPRAFKRDYAFRLCRKKCGAEKQTPLLVGGQPENYLWAVPFRRLTNQPLEIDYLEIAPAHQSHPGDALRNAHTGVELVTVLFGSVDVHIDHPEKNKAEGPIKRFVRDGDSFLFHARHPHKIVNLSKLSTAFMQIVRLPELHQNGS